MRFRLYPTAEQEEALLETCAHARYVWNAGLEQRRLYRHFAHLAMTGEGVFGGVTWKLQDAQLTKAREWDEWLASGSRTVQNQALRDLNQAYVNWWKNPRHFSPPTWRKKGIHEGFRIVGGEVKWRRLSKKRAVVTVPKVGEVDFRWTRSPIVGGNAPKSYRITRDPSGRWWIAFAVKPIAIEGPGNGSIVGIDRGVIHAAVTSDDEMLDLPGLSPREERRALGLKRRIARQQKGSHRRERTKLALARLQHRAINRRKDALEKWTTDLVSRYDVFHLEDLKIANMTRSAKGTIENPGKNVRQKAGLNRAILNSGWATISQRIEDKAGPHRVNYVNPAYTSQRCAACGHTEKSNRKSQADFSCVACGHTANADLNAARNIAAGHVVKARGGQCVVEHPAKREPTAKSTRASAGIPRL